MSKEKRQHKKDRRNTTHRLTREEKVQAKHTPPPPLKPMNQIQAEYIHSINSHPYVIATGLPGTSKTYIPSRIAALWLQQGAIDRIIVCRPACSDSQSLGFFKGDAVEKMEHWILPVKDTLIDVFGPSMYEYLIKTGKIFGCPFETIKGSSWKNAFIIVDEAEDCTEKEIKKALTRLGENSTMVLAGDIGQTDLNQSGLGGFLHSRARSHILTEVVDHIAFDDYTDIVRSEAVKRIVMGYDEAA